MFSKFNLHVRMLNAGTKIIYVSKRTLFTMSHIVNSILFRSKILFTSIFCSVDSHYLNSLFIKIFSSRHEPLTTKSANTLSAIKFSLVLPLSFIILCSKACKVILSMNQVLVLPTFLSFPLSK